MTRPQTDRPPLSLADAKGEIERFLGSVDMIEDGPETWTELLGLSRRFKFGGKQVHDADIVATMLAHGETRLLTFNGADFRRFEPLIEVVMP